MLLKFNQTPQRSLTMGKKHFFLMPPFSSISSQREANGSFNTIDDSGVNAKFVNAVYDALLSTVSSHLTSDEVPV